jgi:hypothetical protein
MAGTIPLSMTQQLDQFGAPLAGGKLYIIQAGTVSTPQNGFQDSALTLPWPNPIVLSASGRLPQFFLADGSIKIRLTDVNGVEILLADGIIVTGASLGGGGGSPVDATTVLATGDIKVRYGTGVLAGFVRCNARTIGSATSGASERANADTQVLFEYLWNTDPNLTVSSGRGASSIADWTANKTIALPDFRSRALAGLGDMGNTDNALFSGATFTSGNSTTLGSLIGAARRTLTVGQLPTGITSANATQNITVTPAGFNLANASSNVAGALGTLNAGSINFPQTSGTWSNSGGISGSNSISVTSNNTLGQAFDSVSPYGLVTVYAKL